MEEIWKDCKGYEGKYQVSNKGRVWSVAFQRYMKQFVNNSGYLSLNLRTKNGKAKHEYVHRLVALAFLDNPEHLPQVNHKDENKLNNCVDNLEWCTVKYNANYGSHIEKSVKARSRAVNQYDLEGNLISVFPSSKEAGRKTGIKQGGISNCCNYKNKTAGGYVWRWAAPNEANS